MPVVSPLAPKSILRHRPLGPADATKQPPPVTRASRTGHASETVPPFVRVTSQQATSKASPHWLVWLGVGMLLALTAVLIGQLIMGSLSTTWDDWHYGRPRTFQIDAVVGHDDSMAHPSHFIVLNLNGHIEIIELPGGDPARSKIYVGPQLYGPGADLVVVTLQFPDPTHSHHPDMVITFQGSQVVFHNGDGTFRPG